ncbi:esterase [Acinetobacter sp. EC24]|nr:esterase [Acinetobacter rathckeae]MBF7695259.1 esterase [Acinetobacter rathckeae]
MHLIYFHGFQSQANSVKGQLLRQYCAQYFPHIDVYLPDLNRSPQQVIEHIRHYMAQYPTHQFFCVGSSLGGFYANYIACLYGLKSVLINPVVDPALVFAQRIGIDHLPYKVTKTWSLQQHDLDELAQMLDSIALKRSEKLLLLQQGDEVLDYQHAQRYYMQNPSQCMMVTMHHGNHVMDNFADKIPMLMMFLLRCFTARKI